MTRKFIDLLTYGGGVFATSPYILNDMEDFIGKYNGGQIDSRLDKVKDMVGATASEAGASGLVPAPAKGDEGRFLCGDGTWKDAVAKSDDEDAFLAIISQLAGDKSTTLPQSQYNTIKSLFDGSSTSNVRMIRPNNSFVEALGGVNINDLMVFNDQRNDCITIYISASNNPLNMGFLDVSISVYPNLNVEYINSSLNIASSDNTEIVIVRSFGNTEDNIDFDNQLHLKLKGTGNKALMDNGLYQDIRGIDISSYLLQPGTIDIVSSITKSKYDDIKSYILNNDHMYLSRVISGSGFTTAFNSDIVASYIYDAAYLVFFDPNSSKMSKIKINYDTYEVSTIVI